MSKRYYWLKLPDNFFQQKAIKKLRRIAGGDTYTIIYLKMLLIAMKQDGKLYFDGVEDTFFEELALDLDESTEDVEVTATYLLKQGLMHLVDNCEYELEECAKMTGSESASAERMRRHREKQASQCDIEVTPQLRLGDGEIEIEKEIDNNITHSVRNITCSEPEVSEPAQEPVITIPLNNGDEHPVYQSDIDEYATLYPAVDIMQELRKMRGWSIDNPTRRKTKNGVRRFIGHWLAGEQDSGGKKSYKSNTQKKNSFNNFQQRDNDYEEIERQLIQRSYGGE